MLEKTDTAIKRPGLGAIQREGVTFRVGAHAEKVYASELQ